MATRHSRLLNERGLNGAIPVRREVSTPRLGVLVADDLSSAAEAVRASCETWGGAAHLLLPSAPSTATSSSWDRLVAEAIPDRFLGFGDPVELPEQPRNGAGDPMPLLVVAASLDTPDHQFRPMRVVELAPDDPWYVAYLAIQGTLPVAPEHGQARRHRVRSGLTYGDVMFIERLTGPGSAEGLWNIVRERSLATPVARSLVELRPRAAPVDQKLAAPILPSDQPRGAWFGPHVVVVYEPGSVEDLCLIWNLRAANGWPYDMPLAVPSTENVPEVIAGWEAAGAGRFARRIPDLPSKALVSASVPMAQLAHWASALGAEWTSVEVDDVLRVAPPPCRESTEVVVFEDGHAQITGWSQHDVAELGDHLGGEAALGTRVRVHPTTMVLPPSPSLSADQFSGGSWRGGGFEQSLFEVSTPIRMSWPVGWTVLEAVARDRGVRVRRSGPGLAAEAMVNRLGSLDQTFLLADPSVLATLDRLGERTGITYFRNKFKGIVGELRDKGLEERAETLEMLLRQISASSSDADLHALTASSLRDLGTRAEVGSWLEWAEEGGVLIRGVDVRCGACGHKQWNSVAELSPPVICRGCGQAVARPFPHDQVVFRYRASETTLRVLEADSLGHILTLQWLVGLFHSGFDRPERLYGGYPGVEILDRGGQVLAEVDVLLLFADGTLAVGEYKRQAAGLNDTEIKKLDAAADHLDAAWTFVATHDRAANCGALWESCRIELPARPRFALTGEHLFDRPWWTLNSNPFEWRNGSGDSPPSRRRRSGEAAAAMRDYARPDLGLHQAWETLDADLRDVSDTRS